MHRYNQKLGGAEEQGIKKGKVKGFFVGYMWMMIFFSYALGFWYGSSLVFDPNNGLTPGQMMTVILIPFYVFYLFMKSAKQRGRLITINYCRAFQTFFECKPFLSLQKNVCCWYGFLRPLKFVTRPPVWVALSYCTILNEFFTFLYIFLVQIGKQ